MPAFLFFPPTAEATVMGSSAQNSSGVHWCRRRVRFNEVPEKVPEKVWEALVQNQVRFQQGSGGRFRTRPESLGAKPSQVQHGSGEGSGEGSREGLGGFGAETGQVPAMKVWEALVQSQVRFNRVPEKVPVAVWGALVQSQVRFNTVPENVPEKVGSAGAFPEKVWEALVAEPGQVQQGFRRRFRRRSGRLGCRPSCGICSAWLRSTLQKDL